jgi:hypothetical protein
MAFSDPQTVTISAADKTLARVSSGQNAGGFKTNDGLVALSVSSAYGKRTRRSARIDVSKIAPDPLISDRNIQYSMSAYLVVDTPVTGYTVAEAAQIVYALTGWLTASSGAHTTQLLGGEN